MAQTESHFPGGSKKRVNRAGAAVRDGIASDEDLRVIDEWRAAHRGVLNTFQAILRNRTRDTGIAVAQRHKRKRTIFDKLLRFPQMQLSRMDDVAGCRLIFRRVKDLYAFREEFHRARFNHKRRNDLDKYDYIKQPKDTGYRGVHDHCALVPTVTLLELRLALSDESDDFHSRSPRVLYERAVLNLDVESREAFPDLGVHVVLIGRSPAKFSLVRMKDLRGQSRTFRIGRS